MPIQRYLLPIGIAVFALFFFLGLLWTAPMGVVARIAETQIESALDHEYDVEIGRARLRGLTGVVLRDVVITATQLDPDGPRALPTEIDRIRARTTLFSLLRGAPVLRADMRIDEGTINVRYGPGSGVPHLVEIQVEDVQLRRLHPIRERIGMPVSGGVSADIRLLYDEDVRLNGGGVEIDIADLVFGPGDIVAEALRPVGGRLPLPATRFGDVRVNASIDGSNLTIDEFQARGEDIRFDVGGSANLRDPIGSTQLRLTVTFSLNEDYVDDAGLGAALNVWPVLRQAESNGEYGLLIAGTLGNLPEPQPLRGRR